MNPEQLQKKLNLLPRRTGVYKFYDNTGNLLYIGKALNLKSRVSSYFRDNHTDRPHIIPMIPLISNIEVIETENEVEALVLESALIKQYMPKYNVDQKDDKSFAYIYISTRDEYPKIEIIRALDKTQYKRGKLFGPYPSGRAVRQVFRYIRKLHPFCTCKVGDDLCLYYHMGLCSGPYAGKISKEDYRKDIDEIIKFLEGNRKRHINKLHKRMKELAADREFEEAAKLRDKIDDLKHLGKNISADYDTTEREFKNSRAKMLYGENMSLAKQLSMDVIRRIECYDISNTQGEDAYGSMVVAIDGKRRQDQYRTFKIKSKHTPDDFAMLAETLERRTKYIGMQDVDESLAAKPDVILIDGGKGQLNAVAAYIPEDVKLVGISKGRHFKKQGKRKQDQFWVRSEDGTEAVQSIYLRKPRIFVELRDEAHRFALKHHRKARQKHKTKSILDDVKGIGPVRKKALLKKFGSVKGIAQAQQNELSEIIKDTKIVQNLIKTLSEYKST